MTDHDNDPRLRPGGPPWPVLPRALGPAAFASLPGILWSRGSVNWYVGGGIPLIWLVSTGQDILDAATSAGSATAGIAVLIVYAGAYLVAIPLGWGLRAPWRVVLVAGLLALSFALYPWLGWDVRDVWVYVGVALGMMVVGWGVTLIGITALAVTAALFGLLGDGWAETDLWLPALIFSISLMMAAFTNAFAAVNQLRAAQNQLERLAAERERGRLARDIHDILGHSLTVITVKAELAGRLLDPGAGADPVRARKEIGEVESLARAALTDVRATVAGARGVTLSGELAAARAALEAADIAVEIPTATDAVGPAHRELAAWIVREGVTNVIRHSHATRCAVRLGPHEVEIADDGVGSATSGASGTGLAGLNERVREVGGRMAIGRSDLGGFSLKVTL